MCSWWCVSRVWRWGLSISSRWIQTSCSRSYRTIWHMLQLRWASEHNVFKSCVLTHDETFLWKSRAWWQCVDCGICLSDLCVCSLSILGLCPTLSLSVPSLVFFILSFTLLACSQGPTSKPRLEEMFPNTGTAHSCCAGTAGGSLPDGQSQVPVWYDKHWWCIWLANSFPVRLVIGWKDHKEISDWSWATTT